ncbi:MAG: hypothetical protein Tsb0017_18040 [Geothermobacteraceae bacterium]
MIATGNQATILLVDDNVAGRYMVARQLRRAGFHVEEAGTASETLEKLERGLNVDLFVLDVQLPDLDGR